VLQDQLMIEARRPACFAWQAAELYRVPV
jgi:hypothetical protein